MRYADDFVVGFEHRDDAERFLRELARAVARSSGWSCTADKTRLIEFGRFAAAGPAAARARQAGDVQTSWASRTSAGRPGPDASCSSGARRRSGCEPSCARSRPSCDGAGISPSPSKGKWLRSVVAGLLQLLRRARQQRRDLRPSATEVIRHWRRALRRRSQRDPTDLGADGPPRRHAGYRPPASCIPGPNERFAATNPRQEPSALVPHAGICAGGGRATAVPTATERAILIRPARARK